MVLYERQKTKPCHISSHLEFFKSKENSFGFKSQCNWVTGINRIYIHSYPLAAAVGTVYIGKDSELPTRLTRKSYFIDRWWLPLTLRQGAHGSEGRGCLHKCYIAAISQSPALMCLETKSQTSSTSSSILTTSRWPCFTLHWKKWEQMRESFLKLRPHAPPTHPIYLLTCICVHILFLPLLLLISCLFS